MAHLKRKWVKWRKNPKDLRNRLNSYKGRMICKRITSYNMKKPIKKLSGWRPSLNLKNQK